MAPCHAVKIQKKVVKNFEKKNKSEKRKMRENGKMYMKNNGTYFNLDKWIFCTTVYSSFCTVN